MSTYFIAGSFVHQANDVQLAVHKQAVFSKRGFRESLKVIYGLRGVLLLTNGNLTTQMAALEAAYANDNFNCGLYFDAAGTQPTQHTINVNSTIGGTRVKSLEWEGGEGAQLATIQGYSITIEADLPGSNNLLEFHEEISIHGNGGPRNLVLENLFEDPTIQTVCASTKVTATQRGSAVGLGAWISPPSPLWPEVLRNDMTESGMGGPTVTPTGTWKFPSSWAYSFESDGPLDGQPTIL
jgi:hypothetical protein